MLICISSFAADGDRFYSYSCDLVFEVINSSEKTVRVVPYFDEEEGGDIIIPSNVTYKDEEYTVVSIGDAAFRDCAYISSVTIPNSVTSIGVSAFSGCKRLTSIEIPNSVTEIGGGAFFSCI